MAKIMKADYGDFGRNAGVSMVTKRKSVKTRAVKKVAVKRSTTKRGKK